MRPEDIRKLLGGYATGTLTEAEQQALFAAALEDQQLFDDLMREQAIRDVLRDPGARAEMLEAVGERRRVWAWWRPAAAALAMAAVGAVVLVVPRKKAPEPPAPPRIVAEVKPPAPAVVPPPEILEVPPAAPKAKVFQRPAPRPAPTPADDSAVFAEAPKAVGGVVGGVPGGVLGGIIGAPPGTAPPPPPRVLRSEVPVAPRQNAFVPSTAETVEVSAAAPMLMAARDASSARDLFYGRAAAAPLRMRVQSGAAGARPLAAAAPRDLGLRYSIVRKDGDSFVAADPERLGRNDVLALRFTANVNGYLSLAGAQPVAVTAMEPYTAPPLAPETAEVRVIFARSPQTVVAAPVSLKTEVYGGEVYAVNTTPGAPIAFTVTVKRQ